MSDRLDEIRKRWVAYSGDSHLDAHIVLDNIRWLINEVERLRGGMREFHGNVQREVDQFQAKIQKRVDDAMVENIKLREALEWYADDGTLNEDSIGHYDAVIGDAHVELDRGERARRALAGEAGT